MFSYLCFVLYKTKFLALPAAMKKYVSYLRVSTQEQKKSGLGMEAQRAIIAHFAGADQAEIVQEFVETESGKAIENRPVLQEAIRFCSESGHTLIVAKLDRLSRDVEHIFQIQKQLKEQFKSCDLPSTDSLTLSIFAGLAQREREIISIRTKQALKAKKAQGITLGKPENFSNAGRWAGVATRREKAQNNPHNKRALSLIRHCRAKGFSFAKIAKELNGNGFLTVKGKEYQKATVKYLFDRMEYTP